MIDIDINDPAKVENVDEQQFYEGDRDLFGLNNFSYNIEFIRNNGAFKEHSGDSGSNYITIYGAYQNTIGGELKKNADPRRIKVSESLNTGVPPESKAPEFESSLYPRSFAEPFEFKYAMSKNPGSRDFYGQSSKGIPSYRPLDFSGIEAKNQGTKVLNPRFFEYEGELHVVCEMHKQGSGEKRAVRIYKLDESNDKFILIKIFKDQPVDDVSYGLAQSGSPTVTVMDDRLYVAYRFIIRNSGGGVGGGLADGENHIAIWKSDKNDLSSWEMKSFKVGNTKTVNYENVTIDEVEPSGIWGNNYVNTTRKPPNVPKYSMNQGGFRLRLASGLNTLCLAYFGVDMEYEPCLEALNRRGGRFPYIEYKDLRTFISSDEGSNWTANQHNFATFHKEGNKDHYVESRSYTGLHSYFVPANDERKGLENPNIFTNVNFDLYFDEDMGSFVIIKGGDSFLTSDQNTNDVERGPYREGTYAYFERDLAESGSFYTAGYDSKTELKNGRAGNLNSSRLQAIKTIDGDFMNWEQVLNMPLNSFVRGGTAFYEPNSSFPAKLSYSEILDIDVVHRGGVTELYMICKEGVEEIDSSMNLVDRHEKEIVVQSEFKFIDEAYLNSGDVSFEPVSFGGKYHDDYLFVSSVINSDYHGLITQGITPNDPQLPGSSLGIKNLDSIRRTQFHSLTACSYRNQTVVSAKEAKVDNGSTQFRGYCVFGEWTDATEKVPYTYQYSSYFLPITDWNFNSTTSGGTTSYDKSSARPYNKCVASSDGEQAYFTSDSVFGTTDSVLDSFKYRFTVKISGLSSASPGDMKILKVNTFSLAVNGNGDVSILDSSNNQVGSVATGLDMSVEKEFLLEYATVPQTANKKLVVMYRDYGSDSWNYAVDSPMTSSDIGIGTIEVGIISYSSTLSSQVELFLGDFCASINPFYKTEPVFTEQRWGNSLSGMDDWLMRNAISSHTVDTAKFYSRDVILKDGTELSFAGDDGPGFGEDTFEYRDAITYNSPRNLINNSPNSVYDFTNEIGGDSYLEFVFLNKDFVDIDTVSLLNITGIHKFTFLYGLYHPSSDSWTGLSTYDKDIPYNELDIKSASSKKLTVDSYFTKNILKGRSVITHDGNSYLEHYIIKENYENIIVLDKDYNQTTGDNLRLMNESFTYQDDFGPTREHVGIRLYPASIVSVAALGEVVFGTSHKLLENLDSAENKVASSFGVVESDFGFMYPELSHSGNQREEMSLTSFSGFQNYHNFERDLFMAYSLYRKDRGFPAIINKDGEKLTRYCHVNNEVTTSSDGMTKEVSLPLVLSTWETRSNISVANNRPIIRDVSASDSSIVVGNSITFTVSAVDPDGDTLEYKWDFGDGNSTSYDSSNNSVSHTYNKVDNYTVQVLARDGNGGEDLARISVSVHHEKPDSYVVSSSSGSDILSEHFIFVEARDDGNDLVNHNSNMAVTLNSGKGNMLAGLVNNNVGTDRDVFVTHHLVSGKVSFYMRPHAQIFDGENVSVDTYSVTLTDSNGVKITHTLPTLSGNFGGSPNTVRDISIISGLTSLEVEQKYVVGKHVGQTSTQSIRASESLFHNGMENSWIVNLSRGAFGRVTGSTASSGNKDTDLTTTTLEEGYINEWRTDDIFVVEDHELYLSGSGYENIFKYDSHLYEVVGDGSDGEIRQTNSSGEGLNWTSDVPGGVYEASTFMAHDFDDETVDKPSDHGEDYVYAIYDDGTNAKVRKFNSSNYSSYRTGTHEGSSSSNILEDPFQDFTSGQGEDSIVGATIKNLDSNQTGVVQSILGENSIRASLSNNGYWRDGDSYEIYDDVKGVESNISMPSGNSDYFVEVSRVDNHSWEGYADTGSEFVFAATGNTVNRLTGGLVTANNNSFPYNTPSGSTINGIYSSIDGYLYISYQKSNSNYSIDKIDEKTGQKEWTFDTGATVEIYDIAFSPNANIAWYAAGSFFYALKASAGTLEQAVDPGSAHVLCIDTDIYGYIYIGKKVATSLGNYEKYKWDGTLQWDANSASSATAHSDSVVDIKVSRAGAVYTLSKDNTLKKTKQN